MNRWYFDEFDLTAHCIVRRAEKRLAPESKSTFREKPTGGSHFVRNRKGNLEIILHVTIKHDILYHLDELNKILQTDTPRYLRADDQPDRQLLCILEGEATPSSRKVASDFQLKFISPNYYWSDVNDPVTADFDVNGRVIIDNKGTAPIQPTFQVNFTDDCGFLALVSPKGFLSVGNPKEEDGVAVKPTEIAINEEMSNVTNWTKIANPKDHLANFGPLTGNLAPKFDEWGMLLDSSVAGTASVWNGQSYMKSFAPGAAETGALNFKFKSRVTMNDYSGTTKNTAVYAAVLLDKDNNPVAGVGVSNASLETNQLKVTCLVGTGKDNKSYVAYTGKLSNLNGYVQIVKRNGQIRFDIYNEGFAGSSQKLRELNVGDIVHLRPDASTIYDWDGKPLRLDPRIKGVPLKVTAKRYDKKGKYCLNSVRGGYVEGFFEPNAIKEAILPQQQKVRKVEQLGHTYYSKDLEIISAEKLIIYQGYWGTSKPFSKFSINSEVVNRLYDKDFFDLDNTFMAGDELIVDCYEGEILLNGKQFAGKVSHDSRFFSVEGGQTEVGIAKSEWATMPKAKVTYESRWY